MSAVQWVDVGPEFGSKMPHGSCAALTTTDPDERDHVRQIVCGFPRRADGTCTNGHPAQPDRAATITRPIRGQG